MIQYVRRVLERVDVWLNEVYNWGRTYITSIINIHSRDFFRVRSYFQGNTVFVALASLSCEYVCVYLSLCIIILYVGV